MKPEELFPGQKKKDKIMRAVLSMPKGQPFTSQAILDKMMNGGGMKCSITVQTIRSFCIRYEGKYIERVEGTNKATGVMWVVI